jgi:hypothetical protein
MMIEVGEVLIQPTERRGEGTRRSRKRRGRRRRRSLLLIHTITRH